jgi:hypothetical protein
MAGLKSKINQNCKLLEYAAVVAVYLANRNSRIGVSEVDKSIQSIEVYLKESGLETAPKKCQLCIFNKKRGGGGQPVESGKSWYKGKRFLRSNQLNF